MIEPSEKPTVDLIGKDGNAFAIMGAVSAALRRAGADKEYIEKYKKEAKAKDYNHLLRVTMEYVTVN
jgi:hypothetical protein